VRARSRRLLRSPVPVATDGAVKRLPFIDATRGLAVVAMVLWHTGDAWLRPVLKDGQGFFLLRFVGGLAAPSFLFLAGVGAALASRAPRSPADARRTLLAGLGRGGEIVVLGYALRLQSWLLDAQAIASVRCLASWLPLGAGYALLYRGAGRLAKPAAATPARAPASAWLGTLLIPCLLVGAGLAQVPSLAPGRLTRLLQVDVLQCIGASLCMLALLEHAFGLLASPTRALAVGALVALVTEPLAGWISSARPVALLAYVARLPVQDTVQPSLFPLFPWFAYACFGAAFGALLGRARDPGAVTTRAATLGALLGLCTSEALPFVHRAIRAQPWVVAPIRTGFRCAVVLTLLAICFAGVDEKRGRELVRLGQHSLRIYWAHMLFAYGILGRVVQHDLGYGAWAGLAAALVMLMALLARLELSPKSGKVVPSSHLRSGASESISLSPDTKVSNHGD